MQRTGVLVLILAAACGVGTVFALRPDFDLAIAALFYDPATRSFPLARDPLIEALRTMSTVAVWISVAALPLAMAWTWLASGRERGINARSLIFVVVTLALGPGLLVNGLLKEHWSRPRPGQVTEFGGAEKFMPWWDTRGACDKNCSFVSGEVSAAAWTLAPAVLVPGALSYVAIGAALLFTVATAFLRLAAGGHFFSDAAFALILMALLIWLAYAAVFRPGRNVAKL
jgi:membrane-associated PAP2 superfamily phosphatase